MNGKRVLLVVLDGFGYSPQKKGNAIAHARTPALDFIGKEFPHTLLHASGTWVGLPEGQDGNSEVGHLHMGAGRILEQDLVRINHAVKDGSFFKNKTLNKVLERTRKNNSRLHLMGLVSEGGVHSHINHLFALLKAATLHRIKKIYIHVFLDGRDTLPKSAMRYIHLLEKKLPPHAKIATVMGRYYAMDRDNRWNRCKLAYDAMVLGKGEKKKSIAGAVSDSYAQGITDEFVKPTIIDEEGTIKDHDSVIFFNFRSDRARQLTWAFTKKNFGQFQRHVVKNLHFACLVEYVEGSGVPVIFKPLYVKNPVGEIISKKNIRQLRLAETEKYAHVTYFFNGLSGNVFRNESRELIPSPKVRHYHTTPEMSAYKITKKLVQALAKKKYGFILVNYANPDMVGHTGNFKATVKAIEIIDRCMKKIIPFRDEWDILITGDHGNAEEMVDFKTGGMKTSHTSNKVPLLFLKKGASLKSGMGLSTIGPTILHLLGLPKPKEMEQSIL